MREGVDFEFLPSSRNTGRVLPPKEPNHWTRAVWKRKRVRYYIYVDDSLTVEKANFENALESVNPDGKVMKTKDVIPTQNAFRSIKGAAKGKGMRVNSLKTKLLCISCLLYTSPSPRD